MSDEFNERIWHAWSVWKTEIVLGGYLPLFTRAGKTSRHRLYIDGFAGTARNLEQGTGRQIPGSPRVALGVEPPFTHLLLFEVPGKAAELESSLRGDFPDRTIRVIGGDCNTTMTTGLQWVREHGSSKSGPHLGQAIAYLDPDALELDWRTVETLAKWGMTAAAAEHRRRNRIEQLILFPTGPMRRTLPGPGKAEANEIQKAEVDRLFGNSSWREIYSAQHDGRIRGEDSWLHYVELYRLGLARLGYEYSSAIEVRNTSNVVLYHLVFATGHPAGANIMKAIQARARQVLPAMVDAERRRRSSHGARLFGESDLDLDQIAAHPNRWAKLYDDPPRPFDPERFSARRKADQLSLDL
jgi:three-Cys-motif partner protein